MGKDVFEESQQAAIELAKKLGVTLEQLQQAGLATWQKLGPMFAKVADGATQGKPFQVNLDADGNPSSVTVYEGKNK